jgi:anthranilate synthase component II
MKVLVLDNYDSFTYNLVHLLRQLCVTDLTVVRNDKIALNDVARFDKILLSPGPGIPLEAGIMPAIVRRFSAEKSILGVCLGHQCIGEIFGARLLNMGAPVHGKATLTTICDKEEKLFANLPAQIQTGRYHSWLVDTLNFPADLAVTAKDDEGRIMALRHRQYNVRGVQFHPESVLTEHGEQMLKNWLSI